MIDVIYYFNELLLFLFLVFWRADVIYYFFFLVMDRKDKIWQSIFKLIGWVIVFPWLVATPLLGIFRYKVVAEIFPPSEIVQIETILTGFFYCGIALWGVLLIAGPVFCKLRMCDVEDNPLEKDDF